MDAHIDPEHGEAPLIYERAELADVLEAHPLAAALPLLRETLVSIADAATHMMVMTDAEGHVLWREGQRDVLRGAEHIGLIEGTRWTEESIGTNAMGTALATDRAVQIHSTEHHVHTFHPWTCAAAPVHDPNTGEVIGSVDVTGPARTFHPATLALVNAAARLAENLLAERPGRRPTLGMSFLGATRPTVRIGGRSLPITPRHADLLAILALHPDGLGADALTTHLRGEIGKAVTVRAEVHRLRAALPAGLLRTHPYRLDALVAADFLDVSAALAQGRIGEAARAYRGPLLPHSEAPAVRTAREILTGSLRRAVLDSGAVRGDVGLLRDRRRRRGRRARQAPARPPLAARPAPTPARGPARGADLRHRQAYTAIRESGPSLPCRRGPPYCRNHARSDTRTGGPVMAIIQCDIRRGRTDDQKRRLAAGLTRVVSEVSGEPTEQMFLVIRELPGFHFVDGGEHVAEYVAGPNGIDVAGSAQLRERGIATD